MTQYDDGHVALRVDDLVSEIRFYDHVPDEGELPPYVACAVLIDRGDDAEIRLAHGELSRRHLKALVWLLLSRGYVRLIASRGNGHTLPFAKQEGDMWVIDLAEVRLSGRLKNATD